MRNLNTEVEIQYRYTLFNEGTNRYLKHNGRKVCFMSIIDAQVTRHNRKLKSYSILREYYTPNFPEITLTQDTVSL